MAVRTKIELLNQLNTILGENRDDNALALIEDITDTMDSHSSSDNENWKQKYEDNDKAWRKKYSDRFFSNSDEEDDDKDSSTDPESNGENSPLTFDKLFSIKE